MSFSLERFEYLAYSRQHEAATRALIELLSALDRHYGRTGPDFKVDLTGDFLPEQLDDHIWTRIASAISCLFADANLQLSNQGTEILFALHRWMSAIFSAGPFRNADHVVRAFNQVGEEDLSNLSIRAEDLLKFCLLYTPESEIKLDIESLWSSAPELAISLAMVLLSPRLMASPSAHYKRELILPWLTEKIANVQNVETLPVAILHDVYMHCSYADRSDKHAIKGSINIVLRRWLEKLDFPIKSSPQILPSKTEKPVLLVVVEWFSAGHSIYRTHSRTLEAARKNFHVIGMGYENSVDEAGRVVFDEFISIKKEVIIDQLHEIREVAQTKSAQIFYMPSVGMFPLTLYLTNIKLAPVQALALGHPATTHSDLMDYVVVEEDYVGDPACFSEKLLTLPSDGMPYRPSVKAVDLSLQIKIREKPETVHIAVASTTMKLNPRFLIACAKIAATSKTPVHFHFFMGQAIGLSYLQARRILKHFLGDKVTAYEEQQYPEYMKLLAGTDMFINPFPFGNTNGIIDTVSAGLVGICKTGPEVHEHIDEGLFTRLGFPQWTIAQTIDEYISGAVRMIDQHEERNSMRNSLTGKDKVQCLFEGRPDILGQKFLQIWKELPRFIT